MRVPLADLDERDEPSCGHNPFIEVYYQDRPFTGIGYEARGDTLTEYAYVDGCGHGRCVTTTAAGELLEEFFLARGQRVGCERTWDRGGQLRAYWRHDRPTLVRRWSPAGALIEERTDATHVTWFADGGLRYRRIGELTERFVRSGARLLVHRPARSVPPRTFDGYAFDDAVMDAHLEALAADHDTEYPMFLWVHALLDRDRDRATQVLARLLAHPSLWIVETAMRLAGNSGLAALRDAIGGYADDDRVPPAEWHGSTGRSATRSIGTVAREVLAQL